MSKKFVITGGSGFIGSHLCEALIAQGNTVICIDNFITGNIKNIKHLLNYPNFKLLEHDVTKYIDIKGEIDFVLHFASPASPVDYARYPIQTLKVGSLGTHNALGLAKKKGAGFMLASTSEVYGDPLVHPQREDYWGNVNPIGLRGVYDEAKRFAEAMTLAYHRYHKINTRIIRIFNTYGPRMRLDDGRAIPNFISQALNGRDITVYGNGSQTRSFCYISDLVNGILKLLKKNYHMPVNLGNPNEMKLIQLAKLILKLTGSKSKIKFKKLPEDDPKVRKPDISLAKRLLKWEPVVPLENGLQRTIDYFKESLKSQK